MEADPKTAKLVQTVYKGWNEETRVKFERYLEARTRDKYSKMSTQAIIDRVIYWRKIRVIVCTTDYAIIHPKMYQLCDFLLMEESGQNKHLHALAMASKMSIKTLFLVGDIEQIPPYRPFEMKKAPDYDHTSVAKFVQVTVPQATIKLRTAYRFHPTICKLVSAAGYKNELVPGVEGYQRAL